MSSHSIIRNSANLVLILGPFNLVGDLVTSYQHSLLALILEDSSTCDPHDVVASFPSLHGLRN